MKKLVIFLFTTTVLIFTVQTSFSQKNIFPKEGYAGIGTEDPNMHLQIDGTDKEPIVGVRLINSSLDIPIVYDLVNTGKYFEINYGVYGPESPRFTIDPDGMVNIPNNLSIGSQTSAPANGLFVNGKVGFGITNPYTRLQVNGNAAIGYSSLSQAPANGLLVSGKVGFGITDPRGDFELRPNWTFINPILNRDKNICYNVDYEGGLYKRIYDDEASTIQFTGEGELKLRTATSGAPGSNLLYDWIDGLTVYNNGHVGILTETEPSDEFQVNGSASMYDLTLTNLFFTGDLTGANMKVYADGRIWAKEIQVALENPWADFVFNEDYNLKTLEEVEKFIQENHHLPDIPSAQEVHENGINVAEMNALLLQKIEELTLYVIDLKKEMELIKNIND